MYMHECLQEVSSIQYGRGNAETIRAPKLSLCDGTDNKLDRLERKLRPGT